MTEAGSGTWDAGARTNGAGPTRAGGRTSWSGWEIGAVIAAFILFWPVGLIALIVKLWKGELWRGSALGEAPWAGVQAQAKTMASGWSFGATPAANSAFEAYLKSELDRLDRERRKLMEEKASFAEFVARVRRAKDQEEFDRYMAERNPPAARGAPGGADLGP